MLLNPGVYVFLKGEQPLYVGMGSQLIWSVSRKHSHAERNKAIAACDKLLLYPCKSIQAARALEKLLIEGLRPTNNYRLKYGSAAKIYGTSAKRLYNIRNEMRSPNFSRQNESKSVTSQKVTDENCQIEINFT